MNKNNDIQKIKVALVISSGVFWAIVIVSFLMSKGFSKGEVFQFIGGYYILTVLLEYPTGVIGDYFSHKLSVISGYLLLASGMFYLTVFSQSVFGVALFYLIYALGGSLVSGSNTALLHTVSQDFKKDLAQVKFYSVLMSAFGFSFGAWLASFDLNYPFYLTGILFVLSAIILLSIQMKQRKNKQENLFLASREGLKYFLQKKIVFKLVTVSALTGAFFYNLKWLYNALFLELGLDIKYGGMVAGVALLFVSLGIIFYQKKKSKYFTLNLLLMWLVIAMLLMGATKYFLLSLLGVLLINFIRGILSTKLTVEINKIIRDENRASILSLKSLLLKLTASAIVFVTGFVLNRWSFFVLMLLLSLIVGGSSLLVLSKVRLNRGYKK